MRMRMVAAAEASSTASREELASRRAAYFEGPVVDKKRPEKGKSTISIKIRLVLHHLKHHFCGGVKNSVSQISTVLFVLAALGWSVQLIREAFHSPVVLKQPNVLLNISLKGTQHGIHGFEDTMLSEYPDFNGVHLRLLGDHFQRQIYLDPAMNTGSVIYYEHEFFDAEYDFDDDANALVYKQRHELAAGIVSPEEMQCRPPLFERNHFPTCNNFHELDRIDNFARELSKVVGMGESHYVIGVRDDFNHTYVYKTSFCDNKTDTYDLGDFDEMRYDAVIFELFTADPYFVDLYGYCGLSMFAEFMPYGDIDVVATPTFNTAREDNHFTDEEMLQMNKLEPEFKLRASIEMAESVAHLHNFKGGRIAHGDLHLVQFLFTKQGKENWKTANQILKISDFNMALFLPFDEEHGEFCDVFSGVGGGDWRSPQEYMGYPVNEKVDIFALGLAIFALITGLVPFPEEESFSRVASRIIDGDVPVIDPRIRERSFIEGRLAEVADACWVYEPSERPDIDQVLGWLKEIDEEVKRQSATQS